MNCERLICAEKIIVDSVQARSISAINIIDDIAVLQFPVIMPIMIVVKFKRDEGEANHNLFMEFKIGDTILVRNPVPFAFPDGINTAATVINAGTIMIPNPGELTISFFMDMELIPNGSVKYNLQQQQQIINI